jgi:hypothetical protein
MIDDASPRKGRHLLLDVLTELHNDDAIPVRVSAETFLHVQHLNRDGSLDGFLLSRVQSDIATTVLRVVLPQNAFGALSRTLCLRNRQMEALGEKDYQRAQAIRDEIADIHSAVCSRYGGGIEIEPRHVRQALRNLGYEGLSE